MKKQKELMSEVSPFDQRQRDTVKRKQIWVYHRTFTSY
jgi:hypothetical protein